MDISEIVIVSNGNSPTQAQTTQHTSDDKIYLDYNATTPLAEEVIDSIKTALQEHWSNPSSQYRQGKEAKRVINDSRRSLANMINAQSPSDIIFTSGGTEANNLVFYSILKHYQSLKTNALRNNLTIEQLPHIIISEIEHDSVKLIAENYEKDQLAEVTYVSVNEDGAVNVNDIIDSIRPNTILISLMLANNETGVIQPVQELTQRIRKMGVNSDFSNLNRSCPLYVHTDAAQAIGKIKVDVDELQVDYLTIVGHKFYGPKIGALYARNCLKFDSDRSLLAHDGLNGNLKKAPIHHMFYGAGQENGLRPGTENVPMIAGLGKAADLVTNNLNKYSTHMKQIRDYLEQRLIEEFGAGNIHFNGLSSKTERLPNTCNVSFTGSENFKGYLTLANTQLLEASTGACCHSGEFRASKIILAMKIDKSVAANAIRLSVGRDTTKSQIDLVVEDLKISLEKLLA